jgi:hypothetical protein
MGSNVKERTHVLFVNTSCSLPYQLRRNWREQRPSNKGDLDLSVGSEVGKIY